MADTNVKKLKKYIADPKLKAAHKMMRVVGGVSRFNILMLLREFGGAINVTDLSEALGVSCSLISHELRVLKKSGLVTAEVKGREAFYRGTPALKKALPSF